MKPNLKPYTALITGASSGIGLAITRSLLDTGYRVIGLGRNFSKTELNHARFEAYSLDLSDLKNTSTLLKRLSTENRFDFFIHSAGEGLFGSIEQFSIKQIESFINANLSSTLVICRHILPTMRQQKSGRILLIGSESALKAGKKGALYSSAKFGLRGLSQALREDCAKDGITVSLINPGMVRTPFFDDLTFQPGKNPENAIEAKDIVEAVLFVLQSDPNIVYDEINLSPRNKSIDFKKSSHSH